MTKEVGCGGYSGREGTVGERVQWERGYSEFSLVRVGKQSKRMVVYESVVL